MAYKEWFRRLQPIQIYLVLLFTAAFFIVELIYSYFTHSITLLVNAYYMLCNILALVACIASIKYSNRENPISQRGSINFQLGNSAICVDSSDNDNFGSKQSSIEVKKQLRSDRRMKNTFGWARINILTMLVCCVLLGSFCFTAQVEALQTLVHISHGDAMHQPLAVLRIGVAGIFLNIFCYLLIGGYTFHHGTSIQVEKNGKIIIKRNASVSGDPTNNEQQPSTEQVRNASPNSALKFPGRPGIRGFFRDILGCVFVVLVSVIVLYTDSDLYEQYFDSSNQSDHSNFSDYSDNSNDTDIFDELNHLHVAKFIDPVIAIVSSISLLLLSYPYMKESGLILLQTIPNHININSLKNELRAAFPGIVNVHDLHVWQLTGTKAIATAHIIFQNPAVYVSIKNQVTDFFVGRGITQVTVQPEFQKIKETTERIDCLIKCRGKNCSQSVCCLKDVSPDNLNLTEIRIDQQIDADKELENKEIAPIINSSRINLNENIENLNELGNQQEISTLNVTETSVNDRTLNTVNSEK